ncbi:hypothetical protein [Paracoccus sp. (in: a-proteobacteria)]|uniref:hypothetical protein n=1 Tax=Paracoccus sp. TaxID=267 RepID=UPI0026DFAB95|nr:hypothetical protein [Paracoccus sp. (in: a-proteobacteria)]MDO5647972.1 hypothetical protein [Paracoccus sp. (in: a-proteobacteria)]
MRLIPLICAACLTALPAAGFDLTSTINGMHAVKLDQLNPNPSGLADECSGRAITDYATQGGQMVYDAGWVVQSELVVNGLSVVSYASALRPMAGAPCAVDDGHLAIFRGRSLLGFYLTDPTMIYPDGSPLEQVGALEQVGPDVVRVSAGGPYLTPFADLHIDATGARLTEIATLTTVCGDRQVPNIYGQPILNARAALAEAGWHPVAQTPAPHADPFFATHNITEVSDCAGTGMGYCGFTYDDSSGNRLTVTTGGDRPEYAPVLSTRADCAN